MLYLLRGVRNTLLARFRTNLGVLSVAFSGQGRGINEVTRILERHGLQIRSLGAELEAEESRYTLQLRIPPRRGVQGPLEEIFALPGVERVSMTGLREVE